MSEYITFTAQLRRESGDAWSIAIYGTDGPLILPLTPITLAIRVRRSGANGILRGTIAVAGRAERASFQSSAALEALLRGWLLGSMPNTSHQ